MLIKNSKPLAAISYDTQTFALLTEFIKNEGDDHVTRIEPTQFKQDLDPNYQYINLVLKDWEERKEISSLLDQHELDRFTYLNTDYAAIPTSISVVNNSKMSIGPGCFLYPGVMAYSGSIDKDVIIHGRVALAENIHIGTGTFMSGACVIAGNCDIGSWCYIGTSVLILDHVTVASDTKILPGTAVKKSIKKSGTYYNPHFYKIQKLPD